MKICTCFSIIFDLVTLFDLILATSFRFLLSHLRYGFFRSYNIPLLIEGVHIEYNLFL